MTNKLISLHQTNTHTLIKNVIKYSTDTTHVHICQPPGARRWANFRHKPSPETNLGPYYMSPGRFAGEFSPRQGAKSLIKTKQKWNEKVFPEKQSVRDSRAVLPGWFAEKFCRGVLPCNHFNGLLAGWVRNANVCLGGSQLTVTAPFFVQTFFYRKRIYVNAFYIFA